MVQQRKIVEADLLCRDGESAWVQAKDDPIIGAAFPDRHEIRAVASSAIGARAISETAKSWRPIKGVLAAFLLIALGWFAWPYYALYDLGVGVREGDVARLENRVAWDSVRQGLRNDLNAAFLQHLRTDATFGNSDFGTGIAALLGPAVIDRVVDAYLTPQAVANLIRTGKSPNAAIEAASGESIGGRRQFSLRQVEYAFFFSGPFSFKVEVIPENASQDQRSLTLLFKWNGDWRLTRIVLPPDFDVQPPHLASPSSEEARKRKEKGKREEIKSDLDRIETALLADSGLPATVANLPAVVALQRNDPASFDRFKRRFAGSATNAQEDELLSLARAALRKSVKRLLANSSGDTLLEITEAYLAYMRGLQAASPESCVALSDESKGAKLTANLAKQFPIQFIRDMSVLERVASTSPTAKVTPLTAERARPILETVFNNLRQQPAKSELLGRAKLDPSEFEPYCSLVIAFYQTVLELPRDNKVNLLRYLYASAATDPDSDLANPTPPPGAAPANTRELSQSAIDALRAQLMGCWNPPVGASGDNNLVVNLHFKLNRDGSISGEPTVVNHSAHALFQIVADSAVKAVRRCQPFRLPASKYEAWRDVEVKFDPNEMFRGAQGPAETKALRR